MPSSSRAELLEDDIETDRDLHRLIDTTRQTDRSDSLISCGRRKDRCSFAPFFVFVSIEYYNSVFVISKHGVWSLDAVWDALDARARAAAVPRGGNSSEGNSHIQH